MNIMSSHVKGHQDRHPKHPLSWEETLNIRADELAEHARTTLKSPPFQICPAVQATLYMNGEPITRDMKWELRNAWAASEQQKCCTNRFKWTNTVHNDMDWCSFGSAMNTSEWHTTRFVQKFAHGWLSHHEKLFSQQRSPAKACPCCENTAENETHFAHCDQNPHPNSSLTSPSSKIFAKNDIDPQLRTMINEAIQTGKINENNHPGAH